MFIKYKLLRVAVLLLIMCAVCGGCSSSADDVTATELPSEVAEEFLTIEPVAITPPSAEPASTPTATPVEPETEETPMPTAVPEQKTKGFEYDYDSLTYDLVWGDEFDYEGKPNTDLWGYDTGGGGWGNNELEFYTREDNVTVDGEKLIIEARAEKKGTRDYTSARLITKNKGDWLYGKVEVRAKLPAGKGTWPAIWMLPTDYVYGSWPSSGEIDIMEHVGYDQNRIHASVHTEAYNHKIGTQKTNRGKVIEGVSEDFHTYMVEWLPDTMIFFIDGEEVYRFKPNTGDAPTTYKHWPFDKRFHLLINIAVGGGWGGAQGMDESIYPVTMEVDYVRVYQSPQITALTQEKE